MLLVGCGLLQYSAVAPNFQVTLRIERVRSAMAHNSSWIRDCRSFANRAFRFEPRIRPMKRCAERQFTIP